MFLRQLSGTRTIELVAPATVGFWGIAFARDGQSIYYGVKSQSRPTGDLFQIPTLGGTPRQLLSGIDSSVTFSPDRSRIAFYRVDLAQGDSTLVVANADGSQRARVRHQASARVFRARLFRRAVVVAGRQADRRRRAKQRNARRAPGHDRSLERHGDRVSGPVRGRERDRLGA